MLILMCERVILHFKKAYVCFKVHMTGTYSLLSKENGGETVAQHFLSHLILVNKWV